MAKSVIHIGANKTGSTTLQRCLFSVCPEISYLGEDCLDYEKYKVILNSLVSDDGIHFYYHQTKKLFEKFTQTNGSKTFLYSNEDIMTSRVPTQCAKRLFDFMPDAEILLVIRNQLTAVPSIYANHGAFLKNVPKKYWRRFVSFDDWMNYCMAFTNYSYLDSFFYHRILNLYENFFGRDKIKILMYEDFLNNKEKFISDISDILRINKSNALSLLEGKRERKRYTQREYQYHKFRSSFFWGRSISRIFPFGEKLKKSWENFLAGGKPIDGFMTECWREKITKLYKTDNTKLAEVYNLSLDKYGYPVV
jgi:hypothetical protein